MWPRLDVKKLAERRARSLLELTDDSVEQIGNLAQQVRRGVLESFRAYVQADAWIAKPAYVELQKLNLLDEGGKPTELGLAFHEATRGIPPQLFTD